MTESETIMIESNSNFELIENLGGGGRMNLSWVNTFDQQTANFRFSVFLIKRRLFEDLSALLSLTVRCSSKSVLSGKAIHALFTIISVSPNT